MLRGRADDPDRIPRRSPAQRHDGVAVFHTAKPSLAPQPVAGARSFGRGGGHDADEWRAAFGLTCGPQRKGGAISEARAGGTGRHLWSRATYGRAGLEAPA